MKILNRYINGNAMITIWDDGTRETYWPDGEQLNLDYPLSIDLCITKYCNKGCPFCYANCTTQGKHGDIMNLKFIDTMIAGEEIAIGGGSATSHPDLKPFLRKIKDKGLIANMTVSQAEFIENVELINDLIEDDLIKGLGVSFNKPDDVLWKAVANNDNCVVHLIAGIHGKEVFDYLSQFDIKILILGYKELQRGALYYITEQEEVDNKKKWLKDNLKKYLKKFRVVSFDNLAIKQLEPKRLVSDVAWEEIYQGDDGNVSFYIDAVEKTCHESSLNKKGYELKDSIKEMFNIIKENKGK